METVSEQITKSAESASIEAARTGEEGKGFAVVAKEKLRSCLFFRIVLKKIL